MEGWRVLAVSQEVRRFAFDVSAAAGEAECCVGYSELTPSWVQSRRVEKRLSQVRDEGDLAFNNAIGLMVRTRCHLVSLLHA